MVTNAGETQMVKSLGVSLGGREAPASAFELTQSMQGEDCPAQAAAPTPTAAHVAHAAGAEGAAAVASSSVGKCPFANKMAVATAKEAGPSPTGSVSWTEGASRRLLNVPEEIRPIAKQLIEGMARDRGTGLVDDTMMDLARDTFM